MTIRDLSRDQKVSLSLAPAVRTTGTATGTAVDLRGFDGATVVVSFGAYSDGTHTPTVVHSMDGESFTTCTYGTDLDGPSNLTAVSGSAGANTVQQIGYIGTQRYVAVVMTSTSASTGALSAAHVIAGYPHSGPAV
ncbi:MAG: hypothetical protein PHS57_06815 [Alphaproteobacteria bacterium]|nr:hypothetical protein [Alphaproteobacteria bacterium]